MGIEIWATKPNGTKNRLNEFRSDNAAITGTGSEHGAKLKEALLAKARVDVHRWRCIFPDDKIVIEDR